MEKKRKLIIIGVCFLLVIVLAVMTAVWRQQYMLISILLMVAAIAPFFARFEMKSLHAREVVLIAMLAAIAAVSRIPFAAIPSLQPTTFVIIMSALVLGAESGFMIGALAALVSNIFLGQGPWTPWQMAAWGMIGLTAGLLRNTFWMQTKWGLLMFGAFTGILFGWMMNLMSVVNLTQSFSCDAFLLLYTASFYFDLLHAAANVLFLALFSSAWLQILKRFKRKYGLL